ncbi:MAG: hypothetical protein JWN14_212, partial [Chthonomonadales bacterium]|nr:hypothetical protein [Chthonomonadales bacterium]
PFPSNGQQEQEQDFAAIEQALGQSAFSVALEEGRAISLEQAMEYALDRADIG